MASPKIPTSTARAAEAAALERARELPNSRTAGDADTLKRAFADHLQYSQGKDEHSATALDRYFAVAYTIRDRMMRRWITTQQRYYKQDAKRVYYLSLEFLMGKALENNLLNLGLYENMRRGLNDLGIVLADLLTQEPDAGLGNGGLGRLAACFLDSLATLSIPAYGYGIRYEYGIFRQRIVDGGQVEIPAIAGVQNTFASAEAAARLALDSEERTTTQINDLMALALAEKNYAAQYFLQWFVNEQVEEIATATTNLEVIKKSGANTLMVEAYLAHINK